MLQEKFGNWNGTTVHDFFLRLFNKLQRSYLKSRYESLASEMIRFGQKTGPLYAEQIQFSKGSSVLIFNLGGIEDAVNSLPAIVKLKEKFPGISLSLICGKKALSLYERTGLFDVISKVETSTNLLGFQSFDLKNALGQFKSPQFDVSIFLQTRPTFFHQFKKVPAMFQVHAKDPRLNSNSAFKAYVSTSTTSPNPQALQMLEIISRLTLEKYSTHDIKLPEFTPKMGQED